MKILFVAHSGDISGGANRILLRMMDELRSVYGIQPSVLVPRVNSDMQRACEEAGFPVYTGRYHSCCTVYRGKPKDVLRFLKLLVTPALDWLGAIVLDRQLPKDFDLIYTNDRIVIAGGYLAKRRGVPHIWHARCFGRINQNHFPPFWYRRMEKLSDRIITISSALYEDFRQHIRDAQKLLLVHDGIDVSHYTVDRLENHSGFRLLLTGRLIPSKGQMDAIKAMDILVNRHHADIELYLAGETPAYQAPVYEQSLRRLTEELKLEERIHFMGEVADITALRSGMDAELMCAWCEAFGLVSAEAMCAGLPVIGSRSGGTPDIVDDGVTGLLYSVRQPEELAEKILLLYKNPELVKQYSLASRQRVENLFTIQRCAENVHQVIRQLV